MKRSFMHLSIVVAGLGLFCGADWPQFRGPAASGSATVQGLPTQWTATDNVIWKAKLPGPGASSPLVLGDKIFVTCYSGYGVNAEEPGSRDKLVRHLLCLNKADGSTLWQQEIKTTTPEADFRGMMTEHGYASNTPATDGERVYVFVGTGGVFAYDLQGNRQWQASVGTGTDGWGSASSVVVAGDVVIVNAAIESDAIVGLNKQDGKELWRFKTAGRSWSTPAIVKSGDKTELVVSVEGRISGLDPATGKELWHCVGIKDYTCPSVTAGDGVAYISGGRQSKILAVKTGGSGDVTDTHLVWEKVLGGNVTTPALFGEYLFGVSDRGIAYCVKAATGELAYQTRLASAPMGGEAPPPEAERPGARPGGERPMGGRGPGGAGGRFGRGGGRGMGSGLYASVIAADGKLYAVTRTTGTYVLAAAPEFKVLSQNTLGDDTRFDATASIADGKLLLRSNQSLYYIGTK